MKESALQKIIIDYLQFQENMGKLYFFRAGSGSVKLESGRYFKSGKKGCPDIVCLKDSKFYGLEIKGDKGKQSAVQKGVEEKVKSCGGEYYLISDFDRMKFVLNI